MLTVHICTPYYGREYPLNMSLVSEEGEDYLSDNFLQLSGDEG